MGSFLAIVFFFPPPNRSMSFSEETAQILSNRSAGFPLILLMWHKNEAWKAHPLNLTITLSLHSLSKTSKHNIPSPGYFMTLLGKLCYFICNAILPPGGNKPAITTVNLSFPESTGILGKDQGRKSSLFISRLFIPKLIVSSPLVPSLKYVLVLYFPPYLQCCI